jgi:hypothetical protein
LEFEQLEERRVPAIITDMTQLAQQFGRHAGPSILYLNFDGNTAQGVSSFQSISGDRTRDIHEVLFRTQEIFAPFDVEVRRIYGDGVADTSSNGNSTIFIGDNPAYGTGAGLTGDADDDGCLCDHNAYGVGSGGGAGNGAGAYTPWASSDFPSPGNKGITHQPNSDAYDIAFVDPVYYNAGTGTNVSRSARWIAQAAAHEGGHTFGLVHVLSSPDPEIMSYDAANTRFVNKAFTVTDLNYNPSTGSNYDEPRLQPQWLNLLYGFIPVVSNITTQNSYTYLQAALGARAASSEWANVADHDSVDASYADGYSPTLGVGSATTGGVGREGDWDVLNLNVASSGWVRVDVTRYAGSTVDPVLLVYDGTGKNFVAFNDDRAAGDVQSEVVFYASAGQSYKLVVGGYASNSTGYYQVSVNPQYLIYYPIYTLSASALTLTTTTAGTGTGAGGAGASPGAGSGGTRARDQVFAGVAQAVTGQQAAGDSSPQQNGLSGAVTRLWASRLAALHSDGLADQLFARGAFA